MGQFRRVLNDVVLKEIHLQGCLFTWSNERAHSTLERIDHTFILTEWETLYPSHDMHSLASMCLDHAPFSFGMTMCSTPRRGSSSSVYG
jgi:hypothetical protein